MSAENICTAIVLAGGQGKRMGGSVQKQYLEIEGKPVLVYSLEVFQNAPFINEIILVAGEGQEEYCRREIIDKYNITKVNEIVKGGAERYDSVWNGLCALKNSEYVFIHDGARPFVDEDILKRAYQGVAGYDACVVGMPVKDTIKVADADGFIKDTPKRSSLWLVQTPQVFKTELVKQAYAMLMENEKHDITDDAMVVEQMLGNSVKLIEGSYENIKITTPEDLRIASAFVQKRNGIDYGGDTKSKA